MKWQRFGSRFKAGTRSAFAALLVIALAVAANWVVGQLPAHITQLDFTSQSLYTLSEQTRQIVSSVDQDVDIFIMAQRGSEDERLTYLLSRYAALNGHIRFSQIDPNDQPTFLTPYGVTAEELADNSLIVDCGGRYRLVDAEELYEVTYSMDEETAIYSKSTSFNGENAVTNAIHYATNDDLPKVYILTGHGEIALSASILEMIGRDNMETEELSLLSHSRIPEDADVVILHQPQSDLNPEEADMLKAYLQNGGRMALVTSYISEGTLENLLSVTASMGLTAGNGLIIENNAQMCLNRYAYCLLPWVEQHEITDPLNEARYYVVMPLAQPIRETGEKDTQVTYLLTTSNEAHLKSEGLNAQDITKAEGDETGTFHVGAIAEKGEGKLCWYSSSDMLSDSADRTVSGGNSNLFMNTLNYLTGQEESISIRAKSLDLHGLTVSGADNTFWSIIMVGVIPLVLILTGVFITFRRKKR